MAERNTNLSLEATHYEPKSVEDPISKLWDDRGVFSCDPASDKPKFSMVIPPPNVTGRLHMGHALNNSVQDALNRYKRMDGFDPLWVPGTDHAGISTQSVVKKQLDAAGIDYRALGREKMVERIWEWKEKYGNQILFQLRRMGCSCDWSKTRFTMDEGLSRAVRAAFKRLYDDGLIYKGKYIVNWCPVDQTALSDDEVITQEGGEPGHLWHFRYPLKNSQTKNGKNYLVIATTRPETMLGDSAVAVNPKDERYSALVGQKIILPLVGREIPIIADDHVDKDFGTGCLKVTPAHDPYDFQIGLRHDLPQINIMNADGTIGDQAPSQYHGLDRFAAREKIVGEIKSAGLLEKIDDRMTPVGRAQRSRAIIEYRLSDQWFVKMKPLAEKALRASAEGRINLFPERWEAVYRNWLENTRDWCISRQIWWGHRIPAWYHKSSGKVLVDIDTPDEVKNNPGEWTQDQDVLDTWFSSALWPYSTLGWPDRTDLLTKYYPTSVLSTAKDIIYFWVARMVMTGCWLMGDVPFTRVYFHSVVCDAQGETMSKSKGNGIDPLHVIDGATLKELEEPIFEARPENLQQVVDRLHKAHPNGFAGVGADALRFTLLSLNSEAQQVQLSLEKFDEVGRRFVDKLWNASRFVISSLQSAAAGPIADPTLDDAWILGRLDKTVQSVRAGLDSFRFDEAVNSLYRFFWDDFCDCYVERSKARQKEGADVARRVQFTLAEVLGTTIRLLHPIVPFVTEELWGHLYSSMARGSLFPQHTPELSTSDLCAKAPYPTDQGRFNPEIDAAVVDRHSLIRGIRDIRAQQNIAPRARLSADAAFEQINGPIVSLKICHPIESTESNSTFQISTELSTGDKIVISGAGLSQFTVHPANVDEQIFAGYSRSAIPGTPPKLIFVNTAEFQDIGAEIERQERDLKRAIQDIERVEKKLNNPNFMAKAPAEIREAEQHTLAEATSRRAKILETLNQLKQSRPKGN
jgi:valyl-tRNA synthetase